MNQLKRIEPAWWALRFGLGGAALAGYYDVAVRDVEMAIAAFTLARLTEVRVASVAKAPARSVAENLIGRRATA